MAIGPASLLVWLDLYSYNETMAATKSIETLP